MRRRRPGARRGARRSRPARSSGDERARAFRTGGVAGLALAIAGVVAAEAVDAVPRHALAGLAANAAQRELLEDIAMLNALQIAERFPAGLLKRWPGYALDRIARESGAPGSGMPDHLR